MFGRPVAFVAALVVVLSACGGDGGGDDGGGNGTVKYTVSGQVQAAIGQFVDLDTNDPNMTGNNDGLASAQQLPSTAVIGGWASQAADGSDIYRASLGEGQVITLLPADEVADLDLCAALVSNTSSGVCSENGPGVPEQITIGEGGAEVYIQVSGFSGASSYTLVLGQSANAASTAVALGRPFVPGEVLVRFKDAVIGAQAASGGPADLSAKAVRLGLVPLGGALRGEVALLGLPDAQADRTRALAALGAKSDRPFGDLYPDPEGELRLETLRAVAALRARADVASADPNYLFQPSAVPNDSYYEFQWHYPLINLPQAWDVTTGGRPAGQEIIVAVIDTGIAPNHPDFAGQLVAGYDFITSTAISGDGTGPDPDPTDPGDSTGATPSSFHGTHVAGTVAARSNDGAGVAGVSWGARVMPIRVLGKGGGTSFDIIQGVRWASGLTVSGVTPAARRADVINLSLGGGGSSATEQGEYTAARNAGVMIIAAAGNENSTVPSYPASYDGVVSVSAVDSQKARAPYSNRGQFVDIAAPGGNTGADLDGNGYADGVLSTMVEQDAVTPAWTFYQGTSMASPHMAGVAALMKAVCTTLTPAQLDTLISSGAITDELGAAGRDDTFGHGLVNALKAVQAAQTQCGSATTTALQVSPTSIDFGNVATGLTLTATKVGTGALAVSNVVDDATWLTVTPATVDASGLGTYTATVDRSAVADGSYRASITFTADGKDVVVQVQMRKGTAAATSGDVGYLYLLVLDTQFNGLAQADGRGTNGVYSWQFPDVPAGSYYVVAGTDADNDGEICDPGEACGAWPTLGVPTTVDVAGNVTNLSFSAGFDVGLGLQSAGAGAGAPWPQGGFRLLSGKKTFGGAR